MKNEKTVELSTNILINECNNGTKNTQDIFYDICLGNRKLVHEIFRYQKFNYDFSQQIACYNNGDYVVGYLRPSYEDFLIHICKFLNYDLPITYQDDGLLTKELMDRVKILKNVKTMKELGVNFPYIYHDLLNGKKYMDDLDKLKAKTNNKYEAQTKYFYSCALKRKLESFIETQTILYGRFVSRRFEYKKLVESKDFNSYFEKVLDIDKVALYTVYEYIRGCENTTDKSVINKYLKLIDKYIDSKYNKSVSVMINGELIDLKYIKLKVYSIKEKMKETEGMIDWVLIPRDISRVSRTGKRLPRVVTLYNVGDIENAIKRGERKINFYEKSGYLLKVKGNDGYKSYTGFIYPNGEVLFDVEFDEEKPITTSIGDAIYNIKAIDFDKLSKLDKKSLKNNPNVKCIIHSKYWEDRARDIINRKNSEDDCEAALKLVKKLKKE